MNKERILVCIFNDSIIKNWSDNFPFKTMEFDFTNSLTSVENLNGYDLLIIDSNQNDADFIRTIDKKFDLISRIKTIYFYSNFLKEYEKINIPNFQFIKYPESIHEFKYILSKQLNAPANNDLSILSYISNGQDDPSYPNNNLNEYLISTINDKFQEIDLNEGSLIQFKKETFLNKLLEISPDLYYLYDFELDEYYYLNNSLFEFFDFDRQTKKDLYKKIMNAKDYEYYMENIISEILSIKDNEFYQFQFSVSTKHNLKLELSAKEFIYTRNKKGQAKLLFGTISDISSEHETKEKIKKSTQREKLLNEVYHNSPIGIVYSTHDQMLFNPNKMYCDLVGYSKKEIENMSWIDLTPSEFLDGELELLGTLSPEQNLIKYEKEYIHKTEKRIPVEVVIYAQFDKLQNVEYYIGFFQDISIRKNIELYQDELIVKMNKRIKELQCLKEISTLIQKENNIKTIINQLIEIIPNGWQYPYNTAVKIKFNDLEFKSLNFANSNCKIVSELVVNNIPQGYIEVSYINEKIFNNASYFLEEEKELLNNISIIVSEKIENIDTNSKIKKLNSSLKEKVLESNKDFSQLKNRYELAKHSAQIGFWEWNPKDNSLIWDEVMYQIFNTVEVGSITNIKDLKKNMIVKDLQHMKNLFKQSIEDDIDISEVFEVYSKNGERKFINIFAHPMESQGHKTNLLIGLLWDVTKTKMLELELNQEQKRLEDILNSSPIAFAISTDNKIVFFNQTFQKITGLSVGEDAEKLYKDVNDRIFLKKELEKQDSFTNFDLEIRGRNGKSIHTLSYFYRTKYKGKNSIKGWLIDISELKKIEHELEKARDIAISATQAKTQFLANMSHEIRTPMNAILGYAQMLKIDEKLNQNQKDAIDTINRSGEMLLSLINNILDLSKIESGALSMEKETYDFCIMLKEIKNMFTYKILSKGLEFNINTQNNLPRFLYGDKTKAKQVISNLISNSIKFTPQGSIDLNVKFQKLNEKDIKITINVKDTGVGIHQNDKEKIFEYFEQGNNEISKKSGTGLGMAISKKYAQLLSGDIVLLNSEVNQGAEFEFSFINQISSEKKIKKEDKLIYVKSIKKGTTSPKILIIDEDRPNLTLLSTQLRNIGLSVTSISNIKNAYQQYSEQNPDIIFLGLNTPFENTLKLLNKIKSSKNGEKTKLILISAIIYNEELSSQINNSQADGLILKPYNIEKIYAILQENLNIEYEYYSKKSIIEQEQHQIHENKALISQLPQYWVKDMIDNIQQGDIEKIRTLIEALETDFSELKKLFTKYIDEYNYQGFLELLKGRDK